VKAPLHLALGGSAVGSLRAACRHHSLPGRVFGIQDDFSHGPLDDGVRRIAYLKECHRGYGEWDVAATDAFAPWDELLAAVEGEDPGAVVIWTGDNVGEYPFLAMACDRLAPCVVPLQRVAIPDRWPSPYVGAYPPEELAALYASRTELSSKARKGLVAEFLRMRTVTGLLRRFEAGRVVGVPADFYDQFLLDSCGAQWLPATRVVGTAMSRSDSANALDDLFLSSRLRVLIENGRIEAAGPQAVFLDYAVRLFPSEQGKDAS